MTVYMRTTAGRPYDEIIKLHGIGRNAEDGVPYKNNCNRKGDSRLARFLCHFICTC